ncbi:MAG TPA: DNA-formamidopyrimidine glycosylase family protein [Ferruginibacter sp.]|nr:DNA-formamidopyrimidine glycosylase family protein [Ferruginibacter sp.]
MPELPDVEIFSRNLKKQFAGKRLLKLTIINGKKLKDNPKELSKSLEGKTLKNIYRAGKEMRMEFSGGNILGIHLMLTGDIHLFDKENKYKSTIAELYFSGGKALALTDRMKNAYIKLNPEEKSGIDALEISYKELKAILNRKGIVKNVMLDQENIRGIGNGYSDEILWETRISPFSISNAIPDEKIKELAKNIKKILKNAVKKISAAYPGLIQGEVKEFHKIHSKKKIESPTGYKILILDKGMSKTYYTEEQVLYS